MYGGGVIREGSLSCEGIFCLVPRETSRQRELQGKAPRWDVLDVLCKDPKATW